MSKGQFRLIMLGIVILSAQLAFLAAQICFLSSEDHPVFKQVRWITWKMDQAGDARIKVDVRQ